MVSEPNIHTKIPILNLNLLLRTYKNELKVMNK